MRAIRVIEPGGPDAIEVAPFEPRAVERGEVLVRVEAAGVNFIDVYHRSGVYPLPSPFGLGLEGAGVVEQLGEASGDLSVGDRVAWASVPCSYATHVIAPANALVPLPAKIDFPTAAAAMLQGMTAQFLVRSAYPLKRGETCIVHAAAGGVGLLLCQFAKRIGARVIGTVSTAEKAERARAAGATEVVLYTETEFEPEVERLTSGAGVDVVYDSVGIATFDKSLRCIKPRGTMVTFGQSSGKVPPFDPLILNARGSLYLTRPKLNDYIATREELLARAGEVLSLITFGDLHIRIHQTYALSEAADAHRAIESRKTSGKLVILPNDT